MDGNTERLHQIHYLTPDFFTNDQHPISVWLVGCGATGTAFARHLASIQHILEQAGTFMEVTLVDMDVVEKHNVGKQAFSPKMVGMNKAVALALQINRFYGFNWGAVTTDIKDEGFPKRLLYKNIVITATDNLKSRRFVKKAISSLSYYWLDLGNLEYHGQAILSHTKHKELPDLLEMYPKMKESKESISCSVFDSIGKQSLFINHHIATLGAELLFDLLYYKNIDYHGYFFSINNCNFSKLRIKKT